MSPLPKYGPKAADHPSVGEKCPACGEAFKPDDFTTLVTLGPGNDPEQRRRAREGLAYNAVGLEVHYACVTGEEAP